MQRHSITKGFTFIELLVVIAMVGVVSTALSGLIQSFYKDNAYLLEETEATDNARRGMDDTISEIREATYGDDGSYPIASAATSSMTIYADTDGDASVEKVTYSLKGTTFYRTITNSSGNPPTYTASGAATSTIATNVRNTGATPIFTYYDDSGAQLSSTSTDPSKISSVKVTLLVDLNPDRAPNVFTFSETATVRNLRD